MGKFKDKKKKKLIILWTCILVLIILWMAFCGWHWSWGPFSQLHDLKTAKLPGNAPEFNLEKAVKVKGSILKEKNMGK
jgi:hypothetical protein